MKYKKEFQFNLSDEDEVHHEFSVEDGKLVAFVIQYRTKIGNRWYPVLRIDTGHNCAHIHSFHLKKKRHNRRFVLSKNKGDYDKIYHRQLENLKENYTKIKENFLLL